jgi:hypothetical protein
MLAVAREKRREKNVAVIAAEYQMSFLYSVVSLYL